MTSRPLWVARARALRRKADVTLQNEPLSVKAALVLYRALLVLYPARYRREHRDEMEAFLEERCETEYRTGGATGVALTVSSCVGDLLWHGTVARTRAATERSRSVFKPDPNREGIGNIGRDLLLAVRSHLRAPRFALITIAIIGIVAAVNLVSVAFVQRALHSGSLYSTSSRLVQVFADVPAADVTKVGLSWQHFLRLKTPQTVESPFEHIASHTQPTNVLVRRGRGTQVVTRTAYATASLLPTLGVEPVLGRHFSTAEDSPGGERVVIIGPDIARQFFGTADPIGAAIETNGITRTIVGVLPPAFRLPGEFRSVERTQIILPLPIDDAFSAPNLNFQVVATLRRRGDEDQARKWIQRQISLDPGPRINASVIGFRSELINSVGLLALVMLGTGGLLSLVGYANVSFLSIARAQERNSEFSIRKAVGCKPKKLSIQLVSEWTLLAGAGTAVAIIPAAWSTEAISSVLPTLAFLAETQIGITTVFVAGVSSIILAITFGALPMVLAALRVRPGGSTGQLRTDRIPLRDFALGLQLALATALSVGSVLMVKTINNLDGVSTGIAQNDVLLLPLGFSGFTSRGGGDRHTLLEELRFRLNGIESIDAVGFISRSPLPPYPTDLSFEIQGRASPSDQIPNADWAAISGEYFQAAGIKLIAGSYLSHAETVPEAVVNEAMASRFWDNGTPVGGQIRAYGKWFTVVGVVESTSNRGLGASPRAEVYFPTQQLGVTNTGSLNVTLVASTTLEPERLLAIVSNELDPRFAAGVPISSDELLRASIADRTLTMMFLTTFAVIALVLTVAGVSGTVALSVRQRTREMGLRAALGATRFDVVTIFPLSQAPAALFGLTAGLVLSSRLAQLMEPMLYEPQAFESKVFAVVLGIIILLWTIAAFSPAVLATRQAPANNLR